MAKGDRLTRLLNMILVIQSHPGLSGEELANRCGVGERQFFRDLQVLSEAGVPIYSDRGYRMVEKFMLKNVSLSLEEALSLIYGIKLVERQRGLFRSPSTVREKLLALLPLKLRGEIEDLEQRVEVSVKPAVDYAGKEVLFKKLNDAIRLRQKLAMEYHSFARNEDTSRLIDPYHLVFQDGFWYLVAFCNQRHEFRLFRVDRIKSLNESGKEFIPSPTFDYNSYMGAAWGMERGEEFSFKVRFYGQSARYVQETKFHPSQTFSLESEAVVFSAKACGLKSVARWVLMFGSEAEVLEPQELRELVIKQLQDALQKYQTEKIDQT